MPNVCFNRIKIETEDKALIEKIVSEVKTAETDFDFNKIIPMPESNIDRDWCSEHWGTEWNAVDPEYLGDGEWYFQTPSSPCVGVLEAMSKKYHCTITNIFHVYNWDTSVNMITYKDGELIAMEDADDEIVNKIYPGLLEYLKALK